MFEQGVIRPPSEAASLLVRVTRNCPWNRCLICPAYKGVSFSKRSVEEVKRDIDSMAEEYSSQINMITSAFLQDADSLVIPIPEVLSILRHLKTRFPKIERITTYARAKTLKKISIEHFKELGEVGLNRIHTGMESGSEKVLKMIQKGSTPEDIIAGGLKVMESGISLSEYIMPGVGGRDLSREHALETARVLNIIRPDFIRVRTFAMHPMSPMQKMVEDGTFIHMSDEEVIAEIRLLVENLDEMHSHFRCGDFSLNLLMQVDGYLDSSKGEMLEELDRFLSLTKEQQKAYSLLQRSYPVFQRPIDSVKDEKVLKEVSREIERLEKNGEDGFNSYIRHLMSFQLPQPQTSDWK
ncbi:MAG TPA: radical SAM protein [Desulfobacteraceae bacterium]|nr:radical SAM protein [Desulfobacteraceae bacterium]HPJ68382.1 radical SAM protein [Desulfobacteraceae bacterium]HPQ27742.1 radical SAM protein [Desulfobacteraceae bacterium]